MTKLEKKMQNALEEIAIDTLLMLLDNGMPREAAEIEVQELILNGTMQSRVSRMEEIIHFMETHDYQMTNTQFLKLSHELLKKYPNKREKD